MDQKLILSALERYKGRVPYMYRCTSGEVTIGIGHANQAADDAPLLIRSVNGRAATPHESWRRSRAGRWGAEGATRGAIRWAFDLPHGKDAIEALVASDIETFATQIATKVPGFARYPDCGQAALFDRAFKSGSWRAAGVSQAPIGVRCHRLEHCGERVPPDEDRNLYTAGLFRWY